MDIKAIVDCKTLLGEGPLWDVEEQKLYWIDSLGNRIFRADQNGNGVESWPVPANIGSLALRKNGGGLLSLADGIYGFDFATGEAELIHRVSHKGDTVRLNDGKVDRRGRFVTGSLETTETAPLGLLYSLDTDLRVSQIDDGITVSNGPCWSPDHSIFYFADSRSKAIWAYDYDIDTGKLSNKRRFVAFGPEDGLPDGATVDAEGCVWSAGVYKSKIHRFSPDGRRLVTIDMPVVCVTSVMFGGPQLDRLYVTSMLRAPVPGIEETGPLAGSLFVIDGLGVRGLPEYRFGG
ncbi:SMP-30/gluconolactonase/LRE family protein [Paenirhodobacter populi]|uniref:SMP-30/gluconolactonase/LRE family protein n=1 Tax=Paenirhodobacter populi TaxID=2306993 RepID=UPI000FE36E23|nr:SMP-30/gluconolactonase/LRE family protein [Sinirhodobacter populi]RWR05713.1 SMP-30/gluconolactonase/LRE family protein [Sinirhodobacter populi]